MKVFSVNDTSRWENHFGCQLVGAYREWFARTGAELLGSVGRDFGEEIYPLLEQVDLVAVYGEGSVHHGKNEHLLKLASGSNCVCWPFNTHKIEGMLQDANLSGRLVEKLQTEVSADSAAPMSTEKAQTYTRQAQHKIASLFESLNAFVG